MKVIGEDGTRLDATWRRLFRKEWQGHHIPIGLLRMLRLSLVFPHICESYPGLILLIEKSRRTLAALFVAGLPVGCEKWLKMRRS